MSTPSYSIVLRLLLLPIWMGLSSLSAEDLPHPDSLVDHLEKSIQDFETAFDRERVQIREDYLNQLKRLETSAVEHGHWTTGIWAHRNQRMVTELNDNWIGVFAEPFALPEALTHLHDIFEERVTQLREHGVDAVNRLETETADHLLALEKQYVRSDNLDLALATRAVSERVQKLNPTADLIKRLQDFDPERALERLDKMEKKTEVVQDDPIPPPDAHFPFQGENEVFQAFMQTVKAESAGFHAGPSAAIAIGNQVHYQGTRGMAVVAMVDHEAVLQDTYDTYAEASESERLIEDIGKLPYGALIILAVRDDATRRFSGAAQSTLLRLGASKGIHDLPYRSSYLLIGLKGLMPGDAHEDSGMEKVIYPR